MNVDLHTHTHASDGALSPVELLDLARRQEVGLLAITDHDTLLGWETAEAHLRSVECCDYPRLLSGLEISSQWVGAGIHIVALAIDTESDELRAFLQAQAQRRIDRNQRIAQRLEKALGQNIASLLPRKLDAPNLGRPDFATALVKAGVVSDQKRAFKQYLGDNKLAAVASNWPDMEEVVALIRRNGGCPVLAHPMHYKMTASKRRLLVKVFSEAGGEAIEVISGYQNAAHTSECQKLAQHFELLASSGSDFHNLQAPWRMLGKQSPLPAPCTPLWQSDPRFS